MAAINGTKGAFFHGSCNRFDEGKRSAPFFFFLFFQLEKKEIPEDEWSINGAECHV